MPLILHGMMGIFLFVSLLFALAAGLYGQDKSLKEQALNEFSQEHYDLAIALLERAVRQDSMDAELYYYLGWFNHYKAYDSRPIGGYDETYSEVVFSYLDRAIALNPDYGDARYFYGAECSGNAFSAMQAYDAEKLRYFYTLAADKGAYPEWLREYGRNMLNSCEQDAILFAGGNLDFDVCMFLQLHERIRTDITLIPIGNIDRPWYVRFLRNGLEGCVRPLKLQLSDEQIFDIHPFKWRATEVIIPVSAGDKERYLLPENHSFVWKVEPDLISERMHAKSSDEQVVKRTYLSPQRAVLLQILEDNFAERPVFFSNFCETSFYGGLESRFQNRGLVSKLLPFETRDKSMEFDYRYMEQLLTEKNLGGFSTMLRYDMPRVSAPVFFGYYQVLMNLGSFYAETKDLKKLKKLKKVFDDSLAIGYREGFEENMRFELEQMLESME